MDTKEFWLWLIGILVTLIVILMLINDYYNYHEDLKEKGSVLIYIPGHYELSPINNKEKD